VFWVDLGEPSGPEIGSISARRTREVLDGVHLLTEPRDP
jgi:hypothetical protein